VETLLIAVLIFVAVRMVVLNYRVVGHSMLPGLEGGEMLLVNRNAYASFDTWSLVDWLPFVEHEDANIVHPFSPPQPGDIVILNAPVNGASFPYIKRIIGLEGETVEIRDDVVLIDGQPLNEPYLDDETTMCASQPNCGPFTVPEGAVFVLGDNRDNSSDSPDFGPVDVDDIIGKAWFGYWPLDKIGVVTHYDYPEISDAWVAPRA
jgi:signal peptidase I